MMDDGVQIMIGSVAMGALCGVATAWIKARFSKTRVEPQPLEVAQAPRFVTCEDCAAHRAKMDARLNAFSAEFAGVKRLIRESDARNEERMERMHRRLDKPLEAIAATAGRLEDHLNDHRAGTMKP